MHVKGIIVNLFQSLEIKNPLSIMCILVGDFQAMVQIFFNLSDLIII